MSEKPLAEWDDPQVQIVYDIISDGSLPPNQEEHWDGWVARRIVAALRSQAENERMWCSACGTVSSDGLCDCNRCGKTHEMYKEPHFVNYADAMQDEATIEIKSLRAKLAAAEANLKWTEETNGKLIEQVGELQDRLEAALVSREESHCPYCHVPMPTAAQCSEVNSFKGEGCPHFPQDERRAKALSDLAEMDAEELLPSTESK